MGIKRPRPEAERRGAVGLLVQTPMGWVGAISRGGKLIATSLPQLSRKAARAACGVAAVWAACGMEGDFGGDDSLLRGLEEDLRAYFEGKAVDFRRYPVDLSGHPPFRRRALMAARLIPYGQVRTYGWLAARCGQPKAARAAGQAMSKNTLPLVIPCHRVVGAGGALTGFGGGLELKRALLAREGIACDEARASLGGGRGSTSRRGSGGTA